METKDYANVLKSISGGEGTQNYKVWTDKNGRKEFYEIRLSHETHGTVETQNPRMGKLNE